MQNLILIPPKKYEKGKKLRHNRTEQDNEDNRCSRRRLARWKGWLHPWLEKTNCRPSIKNMTKANNRNTKHTASLLVPVSLRTLGNRCKSTVGVPTLNVATVGVDVIPMLRLPVVVTYIYPHPLVGELCCQLRCWWCRLLA